MLSKSIRLFVAILIASLCGLNLMGQKATIDSVGYISNVQCTVSKVADIYILTPVDNPNQRYAPINLETLYQKENVAVTISGVVGSIPPNARLVGTPFQIRSIEFANGGVTGGVKPAKVSDDNKLTFDRPVTGKGLIRKGGRQYLIQCPNGTVYRVVNLPKKFQAAGRHVKFVGKAAEQPADSKNTPLKIDQIKWLKGKSSKKSPPPPPTLPKPKF